MAKWRNEIERNNYSDLVFSRIGRLLYVGSLFETNCKIIDTKLSPYIIDANKDKLDEFFEKFGKASLNNSINRTFKNEEEFRKILHEGRLVRNEIAHQLLLEFYVIEADQNKKEDFEKKMRNMALILVRAYLFSLDILDYVFKQNRTESDIKSVIDWIFNDQLS